MLNKTKSISITGSTTIKLADGTEKIIATYSGNINDDNSFSVNKYISDNELYNAHYDECKADSAEFEDYARSFIDEDKTNETTDETVKIDTATTEIN